MRLRYEPPRPGQAGARTDDRDVTELVLITSAFAAGVLAAAPIGPVNMVLIRRGLLGRWTHSLWVALGSMVIELGYIALGLWGGPRLIEHFQSEFLRRWAGLGAAAIVMLVGLVILRKALRNPHRVMSGEQDPLAAARPTSAWRDVGAGAALTIINPATFGYWVGVGPQLLERADISSTSPLVWTALAAAGAGLSCWFLFVAMLIRLRPQKVSPRFIHTINLACGVLLTVLGATLAAASLWR